MRKIQESDWAKRFKEHAPRQYREALALAQRLQWVVIAHRDDHSAKGDRLWAITPDADPEFWLDATRTKAEAVAICASLDWPIKDAAS